MREREVITNFYGIHDSWHLRRYRDRELLTLSKRALSSVLERLLTDCGAKAAATEREAIKTAKTFMVERQQLVLRSEAVDVLLGACVCEC